MSKCDVLIITTLEKEFKAVLEKLPNPKRTENKFGSVYYQCNLPFDQETEQTASYDLVLTNLSKTGNLSAAKATIDAIQLFDPQYIILVGIVAGISSKVNMGDLIIPDTIVSHELKKSLRTELTYGATQICPSPQMLNAILSYSYSPENITWEETLHYPNLSKRRIKTHFGQIASSDNVITSSNWLKQLSASFPKLVAVDMDVAGVAGVISEITSNGPGFLAIRSVADFIDKPVRKKMWTDYASDIAASYTIGFLKRGMLPVHQTQSENKIQLILDGNFSENTIQEREKLVSILADLLKVNTKDIKVLKVDRG